MNNQKFPMSPDEFQLMPHPFGWKVEYWDGKAHVTPREYNVKVKLALTPRNYQSSERVRAVDLLLKDQMIETFFQTFLDSVEFCNWSRDKVADHARKNINDFFEGKRGRPLPVSTMVLDPRDRQLTALALFLENKDSNAELDLLFVRPDFQGTGLATQMVSAAASRLCDEGTTVLHSAYHICNEVSRKWHTKFGFKEIPDQFYCRMKYSWYRHEIWRLDKIGEKDQLDEIKRQQEFWYEQLDEHRKY